MSYCFTSSLQFTAVVPFFVFQWKCFHDHCVWRGFAQWCLAAPFELSVDWNSILLSSAVTQLCTFSGNLHFWWRLLADLYVWKLKLGISKGYKLEYDSRPVGDCTDRCLAENPHLLSGSQTAATSTCKPGNAVLDIAEGRTAAQLKGECGRACI